MEQTYNIRINNFCKFDKSKDTTLHCKYGRVGKDLKRFALDTVYKTVILSVLEKMNVALYVSGHSSPEFQILPIAPSHLTTEQNYKNSMVCILHMLMQVNKKENCFKIQVIFDPVTKQVDLIIQRKSKAIEFEIKSPVF